MHGEGLLYHNDTYYWFGEHKIEGEAGNKAMVGVHVYSSEDLYNWKDEGIALKSTMTLKVGYKRLYGTTKSNLQNRKVCHVVSSRVEDQGYKAVLTGVAVSDHVTGPYSYVDSFRTSE
jgi:hypothetical protein